MCWPMNCQMTKEGKTIYSTGNLTSGVAANLLIDSAWTDIEKGTPCSIESTVKAYATNDASNAISFTLIMQYPDNQGAVEGIEADNNAPAVYYNLQGVQVENPTQGIYIVKRGSKTYKQVIR